MLFVVSLLFWVGAVLFLWTYFGYPLLMALWAKLAPVPVHKQDWLPSVTLLIPAYNEIDVIKRKLDNSLALDYPADKLEIMLIDDGSDDGTLEVGEAYKREHGITLVRKAARSGKMSSVNIGFERARGEIVVLSDASPSYEPSSLKTLVRPLADESVGVVVGTLAVWDAENAVAKPAGLYWKYEAALRGWESKTGSTVAVHGNMFAIKKALFRPLTAGTINDEFSIAMEALRAGKRVVYERDAISYDSASTSMEDEFRRRVRINAGRYQALFNAGYMKAPTFDLVFRLFSHKLLRPLTPVLMLVMLVANLAALAWVNAPVRNVFWLRGWWAALLMLGQVMFYGLALAGWMAEKRHMRKVKLLNVPYFFVSSNVAALFGLWRWLRGSQGVMWRKRAKGTELNHPVSK